MLNITCCTGVATTTTIQNQFLPFKIISVILGKIQHGGQDSITYTSSFRANDKLSTEGKIFSNCSNIAKSQRRGPTTPPPTPFPLYHDGRVTLLVHPRVKGAFRLKNDSKTEQEYEFLVCSISRAHVLHCNIQGCMYSKTNSKSPIGLKSLLERQCLDTRLGMDISRLNIRQSEVFKGFRWKGLFQRSGSYSIFV